MKLEYAYNPEQVRVIPEGQGTLTESVKRIFERAENEACKHEEGNGYPTLIEFTKE